MTQPPLPVWPDIVDPDEVKLALGLDPADMVDQYWLVLSTEAANQYFWDTRQDPEFVDIENSRFKWGVTQLAVRWYGRRNASDVAAFAEFGGPPPAIDKDVESALQVNRAFPPVVA